MVVTSTANLDLVIEFCKHAVMRGELVWVTGDVASGKSWFSNHFAHLSPVFRVDEVESRKELSRHLHPDDIRVFTDDGVPCLVIDGTCNNPIVISAAVLAKGNISKINVIWCSLDNETRNAALEAKALRWEKTKWFAVSEMYRKMKCNSFFRSVRIQHDHRRKLFRQINELIMSIPLKKRPEIEFMALSLRGKGSVDVPYSERH